MSSIVTTQSRLALEGLFHVSGEIPRITPYECGLPGQVCRDSEDAPWREDEALMDERFLAVRARGSSCFRRARMRGW